MPPKIFSGFSLVELAIVIVILVLLAGLLVPVQFMASESSHHIGCSSNQRQIVLAMLIYQNDNDGDWPVFPVDTHGVHIKKGGHPIDPVGTTLASFEFLAFTFAKSADLPLKMFVCPAHRSEHPPNNPVALSDSERTSSWARLGQNATGFSYDWSAPRSDAKFSAADANCRVITADRDLTAHPSGQTNIVFAAFADGHIQTFTKMNGQFVNQNAANDDIYSDVGDGPMNLPGEGSTTRAYVR